MRAASFNTHRAHVVAQRDTHLAHLLRGYIFFTNRLERRGSKCTAGATELGHLEVLCSTLDQQICDHLA